MWTLLITDTVFTGGYTISVKANSFQTKELAEAAAVEFALSYPAAIGNVSVVKGSRIRFRRCSFVGVSFNDTLEIAGNDVIFLNT